MENSEQVEDLVEEDTSNYENKNTKMIKINKNIHKNTEKREQHIHSVIVDNDTTNMNSDGNDLTCHNCGFACKTKSALCNHLKTHVKCSFCNRNFGGRNSKKDLKLHLKSCAPHLIPAPKYSCQNCHKTFKFKSKFYNHITKTKCRKGEKDTIVYSDAKKNIIVTLASSQIAKLKKHKLMVHEGLINEELYSEIEIKEEPI